VSGWTNVVTSMAPPGGAAVPTRPEGLTPAWLTACLQHDGALPAGARVASCEQRQIGQGRGFAGTIVRVTLRYEPDGAGPATLIGKFSSEHGPTAEMMRAVDGYVREVRFYRELAKDVGVPTPHCYFAHYDDAEGSCCLVLEDLAPAAAVDRDQGFSLEQARQVLDHLALMHARYWNRADDLPWLQLRSELVDVLIERFVDGLPRFAERWGKEYPEITAVAKVMASLVDGHELHAQVRMPPLTLAHNDVHIENVFLPTAEGGRLAIFDWQSLSFARHGTTDVTRVICVCLRPELRRRHASELLDHYHRALRAHGVRGFSRMALGLRYRQEMVAMVLVGVLAFDTLNFGEVGQEAATLMATRIEHALRDARVRWILRSMGAWMRVQRFARRLLRRGPHKALPG
jgi:hypothetical protein